ncbi:RNA polymerase sigma-70 factor (sigma-B/F/G subfamily) [Streptomyces sp. SLBN-31]|nr:RNA polymerase sigma-70 factor (sigma-B/F/G subfamily) [Streptomyces sp. SLBN-31]
MTSLSSPSGSPTQVSDGADLSPQLIDDLVGAVSRMPPGREREAARDDVIRRLVPLARRIAGKYRNAGGEEQDDLFQVACLGLVKAVDGYDPERGHAFLSYALPTVTGELKRHLRDRTGLVRLPRPVQEARQRVNRVQRELEQQFGGRPPTPAEIARTCGLPDEAVAEALCCEWALRLRPLEMPAGGTDRRRLAPAEVMGDHDTALEFTAERLALMQALRQLPERERRILFLRFFHDQTQREIAAAVGISQMHVSRLLARCLTRLRELLVEEVDSPVTGTGACAGADSLAESAVPRRAEARSTPVSSNSAWNGRDAERPRRDAGRRLPAPRIRRDGQKHARTDCPSRPLLLARHPGPGESRQRMWRTPGPGRSPRRARYGPGDRSGAVRVGSAGARPAHPGARVARPRGRGPGRLRGAVVVRGSRLRGRCRRWPGPCGRSHKTGERRRQGVRADRQGWDQGLVRAPPSGHQPDRPGSLITPPRWRT